MFVTDYTVISRDLTIDAPADAIAEHVVSFHKWQEWSPWEEIDPSMDRTYSGPDSGVGAAYEWSGNRKAGAGKMTITSIDPADIKIDLDFTKPFKSASKATFHFESAGSGTKVVWQVHTPKTLMTRVVGIFMNFDKMVGADLEKGLDKLKSLVESAK